MLAQDIRNKFYLYFQQNGHQKITSSSLVPHNDPTLLFANAGMNQFKDYFTGKATPENKRAVTIQKCVRAGGKHNDLENVGFTARHHTFFEMLGNFSFGDYFKKEAITFAWNFLTKELHIPQDKLLVTVYHTDHEAYEIWNKNIGIPKERIYKLGDKSNFWEMGDTGPCGPCSEIFYDHGPSFSSGVPEGHQEIDDEGRYVEIWNLVFMQYEKYIDQNEIKIKDLPNPSVDTGAGLERIAALMQGYYFNYDSDIFAPIMKAIGNITQYDYLSSNEEIKCSFRVIADHIRSSCMLITDGVLPSNEGRGYVLRRIIRRAIRHLSLLGQKETSFHKLIPSVFESLGNTYPENLQNAPLAEKLLKLEEDKFRKTLENGLMLIEQEIQQLKSGDKLSGKIAFRLYDTFGFPLDLTETILAEHKLELDQEEFEKEMEKQKALSKKNSSFKAQKDNLKIFYQIKEKFGGTPFLGDKHNSIEAKLIAQETINNQTYLVFDKTPFYPESGGQIGDTGLIMKDGHSLVSIIDTQRPIDDLIVHITERPVTLELGNIYQLSIDVQRRRFIRKNHTATHLLQAALRQILGPHIKQAGSSVDSKRLRFDFTHSEPLTEEQCEKIESLVNEVILKSITPKASEMTKEEARKLGAMALFGEKYGNIVRVLQIDDFSIELCGGTHVENTMDIGLFKIIHETSLASGVRRIEAITSETARNYLFTRSKILNQLEKSLSIKEEQVLEKIYHIQQEHKEKMKEVNALKDRIQKIESEKLFQHPIFISDDLKLFSTSSPSSEMNDMRKLSDIFCEKYPHDLLFLYSRNNEKSSFIFKTHRQNKKINCSALTKNLITQFGGKGGGKPDHVQGSLPSEKVELFITELKKTLENL